MHGAVAGAVAVALVLTTTPVSAAPAKVIENPEALEHFQRAQEAFDAEDYAAAIPELKSAYALEPNPLLLYAWAQAERFNGDCRRALELYKRYLETGPADKQRQLAEANIVDCEAELGEDATTVGGDTTGDTTSDATGATTGDTTGDPTGNGPPKPPKGPGSDEPPTKPWYKDWLAPTLGGAGLAAAGTGAALVALAVKQANESADAVTEMDHLDQADAAQGKNAAGWVLIGVGGALLVGAAVRYALLATGPRKSNTPKGQARVLRRISGRGAGLSIRF